MTACWLRGRVEDVRRHPFVAAGVAASAAGAVALRAADGRAAKALAYVGALLVAAAATDLIARREGAAPALPVRRPGRETAVLVALTGFGGAWLAFSKFLPERWEAVSGPPRIVAALLGVACLFQLAGAVYLFASRYRPVDLGVRPRGLLVAPAVLVIMAATAVAVDPDGVTLIPILREWGWLQLVAFALFGEPLFEEFLRLTFQTRFGALFENRAAGWFVASLPWALLHVPVWWSKSHDLAGATAGAACIVPIGLLWGYVTLRTGSIWPALLIHGFNVWGLQNP